ncbi:MAG: hypothetical protein QP780_00005, partial [Brevibacterium sp. UMB1308B]|nr:hypothetical protein [Brevibacterium sp. UMB1308B]
MVSQKRGISFKGIEPLKNPLTGSRLMRGEHDHGTTITSEIQCVVKGRGGAVGYPVRLLDCRGRWDLGRSDARARASDDPAHGRHTHHFGRPERFRDFRPSSRNESAHRERLWNPAPAQVRVHVRFCIWLLHS